jgi:hypothetical protein
MSAEPVPLPPSPDGQASTPPAPAAEGLAATTTRPDALE